MSVLFVFILSTMFTSFVKSDKLPSVMCVYAGATAKNGYTLKKASEVPERCEVVILGQNLFTVEPDAADTAALTALVAAKKITYTTFAYDIDKFNWTEVMTSDDPCIIDQQVTPMIQYLIKTKVNGVMLTYMEILESKIPKYDTKVVAIINKIKAAVPNIQVGLYISGKVSCEYGKKDLFDFTVTNPVVDFYGIDTSTIKTDCDVGTTAAGGRIRIKSTDKKIISLEKVCKDTSNSPMDQSKVIISLMDTVTVAIGGGLESYGPYSAYCKRSKQYVWCGDTTQQFYDQIQFAKSYFKGGIMICYLDTDDYDNTCGCGPFPVANTFIDGWQNKPITCCPKI